MGELLPFVRPAKSLRALASFDALLEARSGAVFLSLGDTESELTPDQARELAADLVELADDAEAVRRG